MGRGARKDAFTCVLGPVFLAHRSTTGRRRQTHDGAISGIVAAPGCTLREANAKHSSHRTAQAAEAEVAITARPHAPR